jgi:hypothetical protein
MHGIRLALALACAIWSGAALAQDVNRQRVDVALVLTVDASGSIDTPEFQLQKEGIASAVANPEVLSTIRSGRTGGLRQRRAAGAALEPELQRHRRRD